MMKAKAGILVLLAFLVFGCSKKDQGLKPDSGFIQVTGGKVWYKIVGSGTETPLLVLHGGPGAPHYYLNPLAGVARDRPVIFYDQLGCGRSDKPQDTTLWTISGYVQRLGEIRKDLGLSQVILYGHSWGTILGAEYMYTKPKGVKGLVLASPALSIPLWQQDADSLIKTLPDSLQKAIHENEAAGTTDSPAYQQAMQVYYSMYLMRSDDPEAQADLDSTMSQMGQVVYEYMEGPSEFTLSGTLKDYDSTEKLHEITIPTLFTVGDHDEAGLSTVKYYQSLVPNSKLVVFKNAGHLTMQDDPQETVKVLRAFCDSVDTSQQM